MDQHRHHQTAPTRAALRGGGGEIVEVQGGHIVRSTGRKDRHSKVCTAKGPRDRRVRLSAHTAIKFYDVQDRLGYDRPSKAVDWLIKNAKPAIDELDELPPWRPTAETPSSASPAPTSPVSSAPAPPPHHPPGFGFHHLNISVSGSSHGGASGFLPPSLDSDVIADTIKSFFPISSSSTYSSSSTMTATTSSLMHYQSYPPELSRTSSQSQDLRLCLQSFQDNPILLHHHHQTLPPGEHALFAGSSHISFDAAAAWSEQQQNEMRRFQRSIAWNSPDATAGAGYVFGTAPQPMLGQSPIFSQRGPLQSSTSPAVRAWTESPVMAAGEHQAPPEIHHLPSSSSSAAAIGFASGGFPGFHIPARIQGEDEHDANRPPSASSARH